MKKVREYLYENMGYVDFFGKQISHTDALKKNIKDLLCNIIMEEKNISEKAFSSIDDVYLQINNICENHPDIYEMAQSYYEKHKRLKLCAEEIYEKYFK